MNCYYKPPFNHANQFGYFGHIHITDDNDTSATSKVSIPSSLKQLYTF